MIKNAILKFINKPTDGIFSSQTLYECVFYLLNINSSRNEVRVVIDLIIKSQLEDGGFDIGYDFSFGPDLKKLKAKEGTSPELLCLTALGLYSHRFGADSDVILAINKCVDWICKRVITVDGHMAIPYAPDSFPYIHITNATSFCLSGLATIIQFLDEDRKEEIEKMTLSMISFMKSQLVKHTAGSYWPYFYQNGNEFEKSKINAKIDNYHIAQQLYHHCIAKDYIQSEENDYIISECSEYLLTQFDDAGYMPYTKFNERVSNKIHLWGYCSLIPALSKVYKLTNRTIYKERAVQVSRIIASNAYSKDHFSPILVHPTFSAFDNNFYPRSDAWVIHAMSESIHLDSEYEYGKMSETVYENICKSNFKGLENHVTTLRMKIFAKIIRVLLH